MRSLIFEGIYFIKFKWIRCFVMGSGRTVHQKGPLFFSFKIYWALFSSFIILKGASFFFNWWRRSRPNECDRSFDQVLTHSLRVPAQIYPTRREAPSYEYSLLAGHLYVQSQLKWAIGSQTVGPTVDGRGLLGQYNTSECSPGGHRLDSRRLSLGGVHDLLSLRHSETQIIVHPRGASLR